MVTELLKSPHLCKQAGEHTCAHTSSGDAPAPASSCRSTVSSSGSIESPLCAVTCSHHSHHLPCHYGDINCCCNVVGMRLHERDPNPNTLEESDVKAWQASKCLESLFVDIDFWVLPWVKP